MPTKKPAADTTESSSADPNPEQSAPTPEVQQPTSEPTVEQISLGNVVEDVLGGQFGDHFVARSRLKEAGHNPQVVMTAVNKRLSKGSPSAYRPSALGLLKAVKDGEWGDQKGLPQRLAGAGFNQTVINEVMANIEKS